MESRCHEEQVGLNTQIIIMGSSMESTWSIIIIILVVLFIINSIRNKGIVNLALSKFEIDPDAEDLVIIEGRKTGLIQWILVQLKLGNKYKIHVKKDHITYSEDSARGNLLVLTPMHKVSSTTCGFSKPIIFLILAVLALIAGLFFLFTGEFGGCIASFIIGALFLVAYIYMKSFIITIETVGSTRIGFSFKRSFIENVAIDIDKIQTAISKINELAIKNK